MNQIVAELSCYCLNENGVENQKYISPFAHNLASQNGTAYTTGGVALLQQSPTFTSLQSYIYSIYSSITYIIYIISNVILIIP